MKRNFLIVLNLMLGILNLYFAFHGKELLSNLASLAVGAFAIWVAAVLFFERNSTTSC
jgi:hypothetical protein